MAVADVECIRAAPAPLATQWWEVITRSNSRRSKLRIAGGKQRKVATVRGMRTTRKVLDERSADRHPLNDGRDGPGHVEEGEERRVREHLARASTHRSPPRMAVSHSCTIAISAGVPIAYRLCGGAIYKEGPRATGQRAVDYGDEDRLPYIGLCRTPSHEYPRRPVLFVMLFMVFVSLLLLVIGPVMLLQPHRRTVDYYRRFTRSFSTPPTAGLPCEETHAEDRRGNRSELLVHPAAGDARGTVIYLHGVSECKIVGLPAGTVRLHDRGYHVFLYDSRRHGDSGGIVLHVRLLRETRRQDGDQLPRTPAPICGWEDRVCSALHGRRDRHPGCGRRSAGARPSSPRAVSPPSGDLRRLPEADDQAPLALPPESSSSAFRTPRALQGQRRLPAGRGREIRMSRSSSSTAQRTT